MQFLKAFHVLFTMYCTFIGVIFVGTFLTGGGLGFISFNATTLESYFIGFSLFGLIILAVLFLVSLYKSVKYLSFLAKIGLIVFLLLSLISLGIVSEGIWGEIRYPAGFNEGIFFLLLVIPLLLFFLNSIIYVLILLFKKSSSLFIDNNAPK